jgi:hypothetical protein
MKAPARLFSDGSIADAAFIAWDTTVEGTFRAAVDALPSAMVEEPHSIRFAAVLQANGKRTPSWTSIGRFPL